MSGDRGSQLRGSQVIVFQPGAFDLVLRAVLLHFGFIVRLKSLLPGKTKAVAEISSEDVTVFGKAIANVRTDCIEDFSRVGDGRLAAAGRGRQAEEIDLQWKLQVVRLLVVEKDAFIGGIVGGSVNVAAYLCAR